MFDREVYKRRNLIGAGQHIGNHSLVSSVDLDRTKTRIIGTEEFTTAIWMP